LNKIYNQLKLNYLNFAINFQNQFMNNIKFLKQKLRIYLFIMTGILLSIPVYAQQITVTGTVVDQTGETLPGVTVAVKSEPRRGTMTNIDGKFTLNVSGENTILQFSYIGYETQEQTVGNRRSFEIILLESANALNEVVVTGYSSQIRANLTGSVGSVSGVTLERVPVASAAEALAGRIAGVVVTTVDGEPGAEINIRIRGGTSITQSNSPLFIVDGFPADNINNIPPTDILSIDILKDASLTAIYGARGGNGVVIVTTKAAREGRISIGYNHSTQIRSLSRPLQVMDPYEYVLLQVDATGQLHSDNRRMFHRNFGSTHDMDLYKSYAGNNWQKEIMGENPLSFMHNLTIGGGSEKIKFNTSITHNDERGLLENTGVMRTNVNTKLDIEVTPNFKILLNPRLNFRRNTGAGTNVGDGGIIQVLRYRPTNGLRDFGYYKEGILDPNEEEIFKYENPRDNIKQNYKLENINEIINQVAVEWNIIKGLNFRSMGMLGYRFSDNNQFWGPVSSAGKNNNFLPLAQIETGKRNEWTWQNVLDYGFKKGEHHNISFLVGQELRHLQERRVRENARYFPYEITAEKALNNMALGEQWQKPYSFISSPDRTLRYFGQAAYNYDSRYLLQATFSADASTKFAPEYRWGYFPAISGGWVVSKEGFMQNQDIISFLKIRAGIGMTGNNRIDDDMWRYQYNLDSGVGPGWGERIPAGYPYYTNAGGSTFPNPGIKWETAVSRSLAMDIGLFNDRLSITPEIYLNTVEDLLYQSNVPTVTGYVKQMQNIAQVTSRGWDLTINGTILQQSDLYLKADFNVGFNRRTIDKLNGDERELWFTHSSWSSSYANDFSLKVGDDVGLIYGFVLDGIYTYDDFNLGPDGLLPGNSWYDQRKDDNLVNSNALFGTEPGRPKFKNFTNFMGGEDDWNVINEHDRVVIGNTTPKFNGGFGFDAGWKNFDFSAHFTFMYDFDVINANKYELASLQSNTNNFYNSIPEFGSDKRWVYTAAFDPDRPELFAAQDRINLSFWGLQEMNADKTLWNPRDITKRVTFDYFVEDGSFLRLQNITMGYTLPKTLTRKFAVERLRFYFSGYNLFLLTNYSGYDPEVDVFSGLTPCVDYNKYPRSRNFVFGLNIGF
jgi:TonB-linked SusC/RagA family outer membrane protein